jgi:hypothetical protein
MLIDTCIWLDLAKDYQRQALLGVLEELVRQNRVEIILPLSSMSSRAIGLGSPRKAAAVSPAF